MRQVISECLWVRQFEYDSEVEISKYAECGYEISRVLVEFINKFAYMRFIWLRDEFTEVELATDIDSVLRAHRSVVAEAESRYGIKLWPVGEAFSDFDLVLMDAGGTFYAYGGSGMQKYARGFEETVGIVVRNQAGEVCN
jgi:hypothetical protein